MSAVRGWAHRLRVLARREAYVREQAREIRFHLDLEALAQSHGGLSPDDAELAARRAFGNVSYYREEMRAMTALVWIDRLRQNLDYAARGLRRSRSFSLAVIATIALGAGLNATMFSLLDRLLVRPPAGVADPRSLRRAYIDPGYAVTSRGSRVFGYFSYQNYRAVRDAARGGDALAYTAPESVAFNDGAVTSHLSYASSNYFSLLGVRPIVGRVFGSDETSVETPSPVMIVSERLWRSGFGADPSIVGRVVRVGRLRPVVVGVVPGEFTGLELSGADAWMPLSMLDGSTPRGNAWYANGGANYLRVVARIHDSATERALDERATLGVRALRQQLTGKPDLSTLLSGPIVEARGPAEASSELELSTRVGGIAGIVLLIACANVATLLLVRASRRRREIAVRRALGASAARLYEQLLIESLLLAAIGGVAGLALATWGATAIRALLFPRINFVGSALDWRVAIFITGVALIVGVVAGLVPAASSSRSDVMNALRSGTTEGAHRPSVAASALLALQAALCVVLVVGAGLFVRSFVNVRSIDIGYAANGLVFAGLTNTPEKRWGPEAIPLLAQTAAAMRGVGGVKSAALATSAPMAGTSFTLLFRASGDSVNRLGRDYPSYTAVTPEYFATVGVRLIAGRTFTTADGPDAARVMIVSREMARLAWPTVSPLGQCLIVGKQGDPCTTVIGVVEDTHRMRVVAAPGVQFYLPLAQLPGFRPPTVVVRADPARIGAVMRELRAQMSRNVTGANDVTPRSVDQIIDTELRSWRAGATLFSAFGLLALCVAAIGIYSVVAYAMSQRTHEMGVRLALGASLRDIVNLVVLDRMLVVGLGVAAGVAVALALGRFVTSLLFGVTASDPSTIIGAAALLIGLAIAASMLPALRAARIDPATALRAD
jgi:putative ABC transport system permease protein